MTGTFDDDLGRMLAGRVIDAASVMGGGGYRVLYEQVTLSLDTLTTVWHKENLGSLHNVLVDVAYWLDEDDQRNALREASGELAQQKLLAGNGLDPNFRAVLDVLARPSVEFYGWIASRNEDDTHTNLAVLVAATGQDALLAIREGAVVHLHPARAEGLAETLVGQMPPVPAGRGRAVNLPEAEVRTLAADRMQAAPGAGRPLPAEAFDLFGRASMAEDARDLFTMIDLPRTGGGELYVAARDRNGERRRCQHPLIYVDTAQGRWMTQLSGDRPGERWIASAPASRQLLVSKLQEMRSRLTG